MMSFVSCFATCLFYVCFVNRNFVDQRLSNVSLLADCCCLLLCRLESGVDDRLMQNFWLQMSDGRSMQNCWLQMGAGSVFVD